MRCATVKYTLEFEDLTEKKDCKISSQLFYINVEMIFLDI